LGKLPLDTKYQSFKMTHSNVKQSVPLYSYVSLLISQHYGTQSFTLLKNK